MKKTQSYVATVLALFSVLMLAGVMHLVFMFPKTMAVWADEGHALSAAQQALANLSNLCKSFGHLLIPVMVLAFICFGVWAVVAASESKHESANKPSEATP